MVRLDKRIDGVGIGLATCRRVVDVARRLDRRGGSPAGEGSVFWVELPA